jgi:hypothetical protein
MKLKTRCLKVYQSYYKRQPIPEIILRGQWLNGTGFSIGDIIEVCCKENEIVITKKT